MNVSVRVKCAVRESCLLPRDVGDASEWVDILPIQFWKISRNGDDAVSALEKERVHATNNSCWMITLNQLVAGPMLATMLPTRQFGPELMERCGTLIDDCINSEASNGGAELHAARPLSVEEQA